MKNTLKKAAVDRYGSLYSFAKELGLNPKKDPIGRYFARLEVMVKKHNTRLNMIGYELILKKKPD